MRGREFLSVAQRLAKASTEADWRTSAGRAYYALMLEVREALKRWGFTIPKGDQVHRMVRLHCLYASDPDLRDVSMTLEELGKLRAQADYQIDSVGRFAIWDDAKQAETDARDSLVMLDRVDADNARRTAAITAMRKVFP